MHNQMVDVNDFDSSKTVLERMTSNRGAFAGINAVRKQHGADMVAILRPYGDDKSCGLA
ncbi:MAG: hypothetical protein QS721_03180 [Candidatus Endonucleobacter sp. (ex Gigantidas childressi)]|nr:hypothetical protein [Candidatus Endonucleobacter sp. (ex Gigantidas childressi)]